MQPPGYHSKRLHGVHRPRRRRGHIKFGPANISRMQEIRNAYLGHVNTMQTTRRPRKQIGTISKLTVKSRMPGEHWCEDGRLEIEHISVNQAGEGETTYRGCARIAQPPGNNSKRLHRVHRTRRQHGCIKFVPTNVSRTCEDRNTHLGCVIAIWSIWRPKKRIRKLNKLTFEYRMQGEPWCDVEDHG